ncbi:MAG: phosphatidylglycerol lysyltransferase domain-containing protein [Elusimicrobiota bacterium]|jgi:hypothetical protein
MNLKKMTPADAPALRPYFVRGVPALSTYALPSLAAWSGCLYDSLYAEEGGSLILAEASLEDPKKRHLLLPLCPEPERSPRLLRERALALGFPEVRYVPQSYVDLWTREEVESHFNLVEQPEYADYVYRREDLAELAGRPYAKKRNLVRQFEREYMEKGGVKVEEVTALNAGRCAEVLRDWRSESPEKGWNAVLECEDRSIRQAFEHWDALGLRGVLVAIDGRVRGFGVSAPLTADTGVLVFEKASDEVKGLYQFLDRECARLLFPGMEFVDKECDLGDPGLEKAKRSYHPAFRVKSFLLVPK